MCKIVRIHQNKLISCYRRLCVCWLGFYLGQNLQRAPRNLFLIWTALISFTFPQRRRSLAKLYTLCYLLLLDQQKRFHVMNEDRREVFGDRVHTTTWLTCRFLTLSETFSWDMLWSRQGSVTGSSGIKMLSCERARDPMGFNPLWKNESIFSVAECHYCHSFIYHERAL